jgi:hypothetical protein
MTFASLLTVFLVAASPAPDAARTAEVPPNVAALLRRHCSGCHDGDSFLDLSTAPPANELETWQSIHKVLETGRMPPPAKDAEGLWKGPGTQPAPLAPGHRQELVSAIATLLADLQHPPAQRTALQLSPEDWLLIIREVALPFMTSDALDALIAPRLELAPEARPHLIAMDVCARIIDADLGRPSGERKLLAALAGPPAEPPPEAAVEDTTQRLFRLVYQKEPTAADVADGRVRFRRFQRVTGTTRDAAVALCTSYLSGVRVLRLQITRNPATAR